MRRMPAPALPAELTETADVETSSAEYARRFAGPVGAWLLTVQERIVTDWLAGLRGAAVLDVGGGHGQLALPLAAAGCRVTVLGSSDACRAPLEPAVSEGRLDFTTGSVIALPYPPGAFDVALSIRLLPHCRRWRMLVGELCRVARRAVIVDYPAWRSVNLFAGLLFGLKRRIEHNTRPFALFTHGAGGGGGGGLPPHGFFSPLPLAGGGAGGEGSSQ